MGGRRRSRETPVLLPWYRGLSMPANAGYTRRLARMAQRAYRRDSRGRFAGAGSGTKVTYGKAGGFASATFRARVGGASSLGAMKAGSNEGGAKQRTRSAGDRLRAGIRTTSAAARRASRNPQVRSIARVAGTSAATYVTARVVMGGASAAAPKLNRVAAALAHDMRASRNFSNTRGIGQLRRARRRRGVWDITS